MITPGSVGTPGSGLDFMDALGVRARVRTQGLMRHGPMDWTPGTFWTVGNDAMDAGDRLWTAWTPGTGCGLLGHRGLTGGVRAALG